MFSKLRLSALLLSTMFSQHAYATCNIDSGLINYGVYNPIHDSDTLTTGSIFVNCDAQQFVTIKLGAGNSGSFSNRLMQNADQSQSISYNLFLNVARTSIFGDGTNGTSFYSGTVSNTNVNVFGLIPKEQNVNPGSYSDAINILLEF